MKLSSEIHWYPITTNARREHVNMIKRSTIECYDSPYSFSIGASSKQTNEAFITQ